MQLKVRLGDEDLGTFDDNDLTIDHAMQLEDKTGYALVEFVQNLQRGSARALQALVWLQRLRNGRPGELHSNFKIGDLKLAVVEDDAADPLEAVADAAGEGKNDSGKSAANTSDS